MKKRWAQMGCLVVLTLYVTSTWAATWVLVGFNRYRDALYMDRDRIQSFPDGRMHVWARLTIAKNSLFRRKVAEDLKHVRVSADKVKYLEVKEEVDCKIQKMRHRELIYYSYHDKVLMKTATPQAPWKAAPYGSLWYDLYRMTCEREQR